MQFCKLKSYKLRVVKIILIYCHFMKRLKTGVRLKHITPVSKDNDKQK